MSYLLQQSSFVLRVRFYQNLTSAIRKLWLSSLGMKVGKGSLLSQVNITWPHQVSIGKYCCLESNIYFKYDGIWKKGPAISIGDHVFIGRNCEFNIRKGISIGNDSLIASGCRFIDHDHGMAIGKPIRQQQGPEESIIIGKDVWLGCNVVVLKGVVIGNGAVVAAGSVVTKSIATNEIWAGVPACKIGERNK